MKNRIRAIWENPKSKEIIVYLFVGILTTVVSWLSKFLWNFIFYHNTAYPDYVQNTILSVVEWIAGVLFAYPTNRKWVFKSETKSNLKEFAAFVLSRIGTLALNIVLMQIFVNLFGINVFTSTVIAAVAVVISNYLLSKKLVFRNISGQ